MNDKTKVRPATQRPLSPGDRAALRTDISLQRALDHIDRVYGQRILQVYGLGLVAGLVTEEFDDFMELAPPENRGAESDISAFLFGALKILVVVPGLHEVREVLHLGIVAAEGAVELGKQMAPPSSPAEEPDQGLDKYIRNRAIKTPIFQSILVQRYKIEDERLGAREEFMKKLDASLQDKNFSGTPISLAIQMYGPAPEKLNPKDVYDLFTREEERLFKEVLKAYVAKYVTISHWMKQYNPGGDWQDQGYRLHWGLNFAQWRQLYKRYGTKATAADRLAVAAQMVFQDIESSFVSRESYRYVPAADPILADVGDLWRQWGAKVVIWKSPWWGGSEIVEPGSS
jgi:hypothetical protein